MRADEAVNGAAGQHGRGGADDVDGHAGLPVAHDQHVVVVGTAVRDPVGPREVDAVQLPDGDLGVRPARRQQALTPPVKADGQVLGGVGPDLPGGPQDA